MSAGDKTTDQIVQDRIYHLFDLFKTHPIHEIKNIFGKQFNTWIGISNLQKIYELWYPNRTQNPSLTIKKIRKEEWWKPLEKDIREKAIQDLSDFIYKHWKQGGNK